MRLGKTQKQILLLLLTGLALGMSASPSLSYRAIREFRKDWRRLSQQSFNRSLSRLSHEKLIQQKNLNGKIIFILTQEGKKSAERFYFFNTFSSFKKPRCWDHKWRIVLFDIPEDDYKFRDIFREHLYAFGFKKMQQSVFIFPFPCEKIIQKLVDFYKASKYVQIITAEKITKEKKFLQTFFH